MELVTAVPTGNPFTLNETDFPLTPRPLIFFISVAVAVAKLPKVPVDGERVRVVGPGCAVMVTVAVAESLAGLVSMTDLLLMVAVLVRIDPLMRSVLVWATRVAISVLPPGMPGNENLCGFPKLLVQLPLPLVEQETKLAPTGRLSVMMASAGLAPLFVMLMVKVTLEPDSTGSGAAVIIRDKSEVAQLRPG